jgi:hypothetical protein
MGVLWHQTGTPMGSWQQGGTFPGFLDKGDVTIHRPYLVAWPVGSDRRTRRPSQ